MMNLDDFRREMTTYRQSVTAEAEVHRDPYIALDKLKALYKKFDGTERLMANQVLGEWILSGDEALSFDARHLVREYKIVSAIPSLQSLAERLTSSDEPGARSWLEVVKNLVEELSDNS